MDNGQQTNNFLQLIDNKPHFLLQYPKAFTNKSKPNFNELTGHHKWLSPYENLKMCKQSRATNLKQNICKNMERSNFAANGLSLNSAMF